jgi:hypothetical protein
MSFGGPPPNTSPPSGPFEAHLTAVASSPYTIGVAIFLLNMCGRFLPFEVTKEQEKYLNQPFVRRLIIFVIFFVATRNIVTAGWMSLIVIVCVGYLFNENSSFCLFSKVKKGSIVNDTNAPAPIATSTPSGLSAEEQQILKSLSDKAERLKSTQSVETDIPTNSNGAKLHHQYKKVLENLSMN